MRKARAGMMRQQSRATGFVRAGLPLEIVKGVTVEA